MHANTTPARGDQHQANSEYSHIRVGNFGWDKAAGLAMGLPMTRRLIDNHRPVHEIIQSLESEYKRVHKHAPYRDIEDLRRQILTALQSNTL